MLQCLWKPFICAMCFYELIKAGRDDGAREREDA